MPASDIHLDIRWRNSVVFAGEDIECIISFRNIARTNLAQERDAARSKQSSRRNSQQPGLDRSRTVTQSTSFTKPSFNRQPSITSSSTYVQHNGHRHTLSLGVEPNTPQSTSGPIPPISPARPTRSTNAHGRSLSILSLVTERGAVGQNGGATAVRQGGHARATSLQTMPRHSRQISAEQAFTQPERDRAKGKIAPDFQFPPPVQVEGDDEDGPETPPLPQGEIVKSRKQSQLLSPLSPGNTSGQPTTFNALARVTSETSADDVSRTSGDFDAPSTISEETAFSDSQALPTSAPRPRPSLSRRSSSRQAPSRPQLPEHLMMGYVQTMGSFSVDGSLVNQAPFEEVKRRGVISTQAGGGVVGVERSKRESGLFGAFGWSNIGESLTGLLGMDDMSSVREMRNVANTKTIPLLSTPQTILFVDLKLAPGQHRSYSYKFKLPKGLPPSHKGRSIKVTYHLRIAVQRPGSREGQQIKDVEVPFRVLGSVDKSGEILGHDLMSPYVLLQDVAKSSQVSESFDSSAAFPASPSTEAAAASPTDIGEFLHYTQRLLAEKSDGAPLLSPTLTRNGRRLSEGAPQLRTMDECIGFAIMRSNHRATATDTSQSSSRFTIARAGHYVGVLSMLRPSYRSGETVLIKLDFSPEGSATSASPSVSPPPNLKAYIVVVTLETTEKIDPSLALRSTTSITRVTRKIYASITETVLFATQVSFALEIPPAAAPTFDTTGVSLEWRVRVEFTTSILPPKRASLLAVPTRDYEDPQLDQTEGEEGASSGSSDDENTGLEAHAGNGQSAPVTSRALSQKQVSSGTALPGSEAAEAWLTADDLLETVSEDDRGRILVAKEALNAETFEVAVPIRVYGVQPAVGPAGVKSEMYDI